jgi:hypothetical protein
MSTVAGPSGRVTGTRTATSPASPPPSRYRRRGGTATRFPFLALGVVSLLVGLWAGLLMLGLHVPTWRHSLGEDHGPLMTLGFLGTVISLERAVALRRRWAFTAPAAAGAGGLALVAGLPGWVGWSLLCLASVIFLLVYAAAYRIAPALHLVIMAGGGLCWYLTTVLWLGGRIIDDLVPLLAGFLILTILGERLELARVALLTRASTRTFLAGVGVLATGLLLVAASVRSELVGARIAGAGLIGLALWGARFDVARRTIRVPGVTRFMAVSLLAGYVWLVVAGLTWLGAGNLHRSDAIYDAALHAVFLGFVMSMIFAHAPVIVPAVLRVRLPFRPWFYAHTALLHAALLVRLVCGDALGNRIAWQVGGVGTELAILLFLAASITAVLRARRTKPA